VIDRLTDATRRLRWQAGQLRSLPTLPARLRFLWWTVLCHYCCETCDDCGRRVAPHTGSWWHADDELWHQVVADSLGPVPSVLCPPCFTRRADTTGIHLSWQAKVEWRDGEEVRDPGSDYRLQRLGPKLVADYGNVHIEVAHNVLTVTAYGLEEQVEASGVAHVLRQIAATAEQEGR
jgi:hypothetical protein